MGLIQTGMGLIVGFCLTLYVGWATTTRQMRRDTVVAAVVEAKAELKKLAALISVHQKDQASDEAWFAVTGQLKTLGLSISCVDALLREAKFDTTTCRFDEVQRTYDAIRPMVGERIMKKPAQVDQRLAFLFQSLSLLAIRVAAE